MSFGNGAIISIEWGDHHTVGALSIKRLQAGMVLSEDLTDRMGRLLMTRGTVLTGKYLKICKMWGVIEAQIEGVSGEDMNASALNDFDPAEIAIASESVRRRFCHADMDHPAIRELVRLSIIRTAEGKNISDDFMPPSRISEENTEHQNGKAGKANPLKFVGEHTKLSTLPDVYGQLLNAIAKPSSSMYDIENVINKDTNLSARLLKIVNSAFYGYPSKIDTLSRAVSVIGMRQLSTLAIGINIINVFHNIPSDIIDMKMFWKHSILCGICARILASYKNIQNTERMFTAGLLHDIGRLVCYNYLPRESLDAVMEANNNRQLLYLVESDAFSLDHASLGGSLLNQWQMPLSLEDMVCHHHKPEKSKNLLESSILHLADIMANTMGVGTSGERLIPPLHAEAWMRIGMTPNILSLAIEQADCQLEDVFKVLYVENSSQ
jgi:HD-like signal output (HDOD) protein